MIDWKPVDSIPYDENVLLWHESGNVSQDFLYDAGPDWLRERGYTHWAKINPPEATK